MQTLLHNVRRTKSSAMLDLAKNSPQKAMISGGQDSRQNPLRLQ